MMHTFAEERPPSAPYPRRMTHPSPGAAVKGYDSHAEAGHQEELSRAAVEAG